MHKRGLCRHEVFVCVSVCLSVTFVDHDKMNKHIFKIFYHHSSFPYQTEWRYSDGNPSNGGVECRWGRQKMRFWTNIWLRCTQVYSVVNRTSREVWKIKPQRTASSTPRRPSSVVRTRRRRSACDVIRRRGGHPLGHNPLVITPVFCCRRTS